MSISAASSAITEQAGLFERLQRAKLSFAYSSKWINPTSPLGRYAVQTGRTIGPAGLIPSAADVDNYEKDRLRIMAMLTAAEPIYVAPAPSDLISDAAHSIPDWALRPTDLLVPCGFVLYAAPIQLFGERRLQSLTFCRWKASRPGEPGRLVHDEDSPNDDGVLFGLAFTDQTDATAMQWRYGWTRLQLYERLFGATGRGSFATVPPTAPEEAIYRRLLSVLASTLAFLQQRILTRERYPGDRTSRRRAAAQGLPPREVEVVTLRRLQPPSDSQDPAAASSPDWSCRWWVGGHWRQQACGPGREQRRPTWISPYIKGPGDKPVRAKRRLFQVVR